MSAITTYLNVRRLLRQVVEPRLDKIEQNLSRIEAKLDKLLTGKRGTRAKG